MTLWYIEDKPGSPFAKSPKNLDQNPLSTVTCQGISAINRTDYYIYNDGQPSPSSNMKNRSEKPPYRVSTMGEIAEIPWNGFNVVSTFSGCGGSCLGYRMAGFRVLWANEFVPIAQKSYQANAAPDSILDPRDIRTIQPEEILVAIGLQPGELDLLDGSPPCQAFSSAGKRDKGWGKEKRYEHGARQRNEDLFFDYIRILKGLQPKTFVAENVSGLIKGKAKGYFLEILAGLKACGYRVSAKLLDAQWLGVPQARQRLIFIGVREDLGIEPVYPKPLPYRYSVSEAIPWISSARRQASRNWDASTEPSPTILATCPPVSMLDVEPETDISPFAIGREWANTAVGSRNSKFFNLRKADPSKPSPTILAAGGNPSTATVTHPTERRKFTIAELRRICSFPDDFVLVGSYAQQWERLGNSVPPLMMRAIANCIRDQILKRIPKR